MMVNLFKVEESSGGCGGELSEVPTTGGCPLLGVPTYRVNARVDSDFTTGFLDIDDLIAIFE
jgi:hypothetical protein